MPVYYPPTGFHFKVEFQDVEGMNDDTYQRFQDVGGLSFEIEIETLREGGENRFEHKLPKRAKYPNLVLKRGMITNKVLINWINKAMDTFFTVVIYDFKPKDILITLMDEAGNALAVWNVIQAFPVKWSISDLKASQNEIVVETLELAYQYFERKM